MSTEKLHYLKFENYVLFDGHTEDLSLGDRLSDSSKGLFQRGKGGVWIYRSSAKTNLVVEHKKISAN